MTNIFNYFLRRGASQSANFPLITFDFICISAGDFGRFLISYDGIHRPCHHPCPYPGYCNIPPLLASDASPAASLPAWPFGARADPPCSSPDAAYTCASVSFSLCVFVCSPAGEVNSI